MKLFLTDLFYKFILSATYVSGIVPDTLYTCYHLTLKITLGVSLFIISILQIRKLSQVKVNCVVQVHTGQGSEP
jgi:hypothetical protein